MGGDGERKRETLKEQPNTLADIRRGVRQQLDQWNLLDFVLSAGASALQRFQGLFKPAS